MDRDLGKESVIDISCLVTSLKKMANIFEQQTFEVKEKFGCQVTENPNCTNSEMTAAMSNGSSSYLNL